MSHLNQRPRLDTEGERRIRIVHLCTRLPVGGMENVVLSLLRHMPEPPYQSAVWCLEEADVLGRELLGQGHPVVELRKQRRRDPVMFFRIARLVRRKPVDILHCHDELSWFYGTIGARLATRGTRVVVTMHGRRPGISRRHLYEQQALALLTSAIVTVSSSLRRELTAELRLSESRVLAIPNGIAFPIGFPSEEERQRARVELGVPAAAVVVGSVGELSAIKNLDLMIEAAQVAKRSFPDLRVVFIGDGGHRERLVRKAAEFGLADSVVFAGVRRNVAELLAAFDIYVCSSDYEGVSLSILEAMARGRPIIATSVGGNPELIRAGETGILVPKQDRSALATSLVRVLRDEALRQRLGQQAQQLVRNAYSAERMIAGYDRLYRLVLDRAASRLQFEPSSPFRSAPGNSRASLAPPHT